MNAHGGSRSAAELLGPALQFDPRRTLRRVWWAKAFAFAKLVGLAALVVGAIAQGRVGTGIFFAFWTLPDAWQAWRSLPDAGSLVADGDFLEAERAGLEEKLDRQRSRTVLSVILAALCLWAATAGTRGAFTLVCFAAFLLVQAAVRAFVISPSIVRELRDFGISPGGWAFPIVMGGLFVLMPFLVLGGLLYRGFRRLIGRPVPDEPDDVEPDDDEAGADDAPRSKRAQDEDEA